MMGQIFDVLLLLLHFLAGVVFLFLFALPWLWGVIDMLGCHRFARKPEYDYTASVLHWWEIKSLFATQSKAMVKLFPWLSMDLSEDRDVTEEDGKIT